MGINLDKGNISALKNQMQEINFNAESCASARRLHGSFAEANATEYIRKFAGHKLDECKRTHGLFSCYSWFDYFGTLCVGVETPTYKLS